MKFGFDFGSRNIHCVVLQENDVIFQKLLPHNGNVIATFDTLIQATRQHISQDPIDTFGITGSIDLNAVTLIDPVLASVKANQWLKTGCQNILSIGCEKFYLVFLDNEFNYVGHVMNSDCASGTGSFIDQQAARLGYTTEEFAQNAFAFHGKSPSIATRCSVFAKSDIIHSQAEGFSKEAIAAGICEGMVRNIFHNVIRGRKLEGALLLIGGVSHNPKVISEIEKQLGSNITILSNSSFVGAIGAALLGRQKNLTANIIEQTNTHQRGTRKKLEIRLTRYPDFDQDKSFTEDGIEVTVYGELAGEKQAVFLGVDVGSTSSKIILVDPDKNILLGLYTRTSGDPVDAISRLFLMLQKIWAGKFLSIRGVAVTGSGRQLIKEIIGADIAINEITAHARGATFIDPAVDTIIEIGGQDSKFTVLKDGCVRHAVMNYVCAAGTGSFIEEQATKLGIKLAEISQMALGQESPLTSDRCTVYMERDLNVFLAEGWSKEQIMAATLFSVRDNYISKVAGRTLWGNHVYFQGATAKNKALVAAFENDIKKPICVSKYCHLTGALGAALAVMENNQTCSSFRGIDFAFSHDQETCSLCANKCSLTVYTVNGTKIAWGLKCNREYEVKKPGIITPRSRLEQKHQTYFESFHSNNKGRLTIGIPLTLYMKEYSALFYDFFTSLGWNVVLEKDSSAKLAGGAQIACADFCAPILATHGLIQSLSDKNVNYIFFPSITNEQDDGKPLPKEEDFLRKDRDAYFCYYAQYASTIVDNLLTLDIRKKLISPKIKFHNLPIETVAREIARSLSEVSSVPADVMADLFITAYVKHQERKKAWKDCGRAVLSTNTDQMKIILLGRPYVIFDETLNSGIPAKLEALGLDVIHQSMLDLTYDEATDHEPYLNRMHWHYGQQILKAAEWIGQNDAVYPVFLTSFRCSPDAYVITYFKEMMERVNKPYLIIQLDEHCSDIGYQTRIEAGIDAFKNHFHTISKQASFSSPAFPKNFTPYETKITQNDIIFFPYLSPILDETLFAAFEAHGYKAKVLPINQAIINLGYKYVSGGECLPNVAIVGSIIDMFQRKDLNVEKSVIYLGDSCIACNFHQYTSLIQAACRKAGIEGLRIYSPKLCVPDNVLPKELSMDMAAVSVLGSLLYKLYFRFHPYESEKGATQKALDESIAIIKKYLRKKTPLWEIPLQKSGDVLSALYFDHFIKCTPTQVEPLTPSSDASSANSFIDKVKDFLHPSKYMISAAKEIRALFEKIPQTGSRKPRIGLLGDLYIKYNPILNQNIYQLIEELGGEILIPSYMETGIHLMDANERENGADKIPRLKSMLYEQTFEQVFRGILDDSFEPPVEECAQLLQEYGIKHYIPGETTINIGRLLYYVKHQTVQAIIHINPILCCPGSVTSSVYRSLQKKCNTPIIDVFYDGINKPNGIIIPQMNTIVESQ